jgi:TolB protein
VLTTEEPQITTPVDPTLLIEEARARQRQRQRRGAVILFGGIVLVAAAAWIAQWATGASGLRSSTFSPGSGSGPRRIAFSLFSAPTPGAPGQPDIYTMNSRHRDIRRLTHTGSAAFPAWSPDGTHIAFAWQSKQAPNGSVHGRLYVMNSDGSGRRLVAAAGWGSPAWSPDGSKIAFSRNYDIRPGRPVQNIYVVEPNGSGLHLLARNGLSPAWSPDGTTIAYSEWHENQASWIDVMNSDGTGRHRLARGYFPAWSPDGKTIAFLKDQVGEFSDQPGIWVHTQAVLMMNADGSDTRPLHIRSWVDCALQWSPGGQLAVSNPAGLFLVRLAGHVVTKLSSQDICGIAWQPAARPADR